MSAGGRARSPIVAVVRWTALLLTLGMVSGCTRTEPPNLVVIVVDTLRADHLGCYGYGRPTSPNIDRFAADAVLFENAFAQSSWTAPSVASFFTSLYPSAHGVTTFVSTLPASVPTMAEVLQRQGFKTTGLSANFVQVVAQKGFGRGFDTFAELHRPAAAGEDAEFIGRVAADARTVTNRAIEEVSRSRHSRFLLYVHYMDPHSTYAPPEPYRSRFLRPYDGPFTGGTEQLKRVMQGELPIDDADLGRLIDLYDAEIAYVDAEVGRFFEELRRLDLFDDTVIAILSDHGEEFGEHGGVFHGVTLYDEMTHVPLVVRLPGGKHGGVRLSHVVELVDLGPTLLELLGLADDRTHQGQSFAALVQAREAARSDGRAFSELHPDPAVEQALRPRTHRRALATEDWTYIVGRDDAAELHSRGTNDTGEGAGGSVGSDLAARLRRELAAFAVTVEGWRTTEAEEVPLSAQDRENLRALGYLP